MKILSWNINGLKSALSSGFEKTINKLNEDVICIQETKITKEIKELKLNGYNKYFNYTNKAGYSGVAIFAKKKAENIILGMPIETDDDELENLDEESRVLTIEYNDFFVVCVYVPCSAKTIEKKRYRINFDYNFCTYIEKLNSLKNVIICGDFNICHKSIDICNIEKHKNLDIFSDEDKTSFNNLLDLGFIDTFRYMHSRERRFTFWTNDIKDRQNCNFGWRLDYILVSNYMKKHIREANILYDVKGSDHCPVELVIREK